MKEHSMYQKMRIFFIATLAIVNLSFASSPQWSLEEVTSGWNANWLVKTYFHNSELQRQWAWELMGKYPLSGDEKILDFGCGDGKMSAELSRLVSQGTVTGVDISSEMVAFAKLKFPNYAYPNLKFLKSNSLIFDDIPAQQAYDVICSFCVFHQVARQVETLRQLKAHLKPAGRLLLVIPAGKNPAFFNAANEIFTQYQLTPPWKNQSTSVVPTMRTVEGCSALLKEAGYQVLKLEMIDTDNPFYDKTELIEWMVGNTTANWSIPLDVSPAFFKDLVERMCELDSGVIDQEGRVHFKLSRIHAVATF
ncbi:MAG: class I SAM-dependent methyltransferase [Rhabdochlamydiaceae bacterium]